jgi:hypothetical protein
MNLNLQPVLREATTAAEAIAMIKEQPRAAGMIVLVADGTQATALEVTDKVVREFDAEDGVLIRTNHYFAPDLQDVVPTFEENPSSFDRHARVTEMVEQRYGRIGMHDILAIVSDHSLPPVHSICRHGDGDGESKTVSATISCPEDRTMWATLSNPCEAIQAIGLPGQYRARTAGDRSERTRREY